MVQLSCLVFLFCVWLPLYTVCSEEKISEEGNTVPLLQDFKVKFTPGLINITWNCNITKSMKAYTYKVVFQRGFQETLNTTTCLFLFDVHIYMEFILHKGLSVQMLVYKEKLKVYGGDEVIYMPEGKNNSAAENFACTIYRVYIMNCSWTVGKEAPEDTQYSLILRQSPRYVKCQDYRTDSFGRQVGCVMKHPNISFKSNVYAEVLGFSNQMPIQFFDKVFEPFHDVILDPPRNITLTYKLDELEIIWQKPETYEQHMESWFQYNINIKDKGGIQTIDIQGSKENIYKTTKFHPNEKVIVTMRVKWHDDVSNDHEWSAWSEPHIIGYNSAQLTPNQMLIAVGAGTAFILIVLSFLCYRFRVWKTLFPQVPTPSMKLFKQVEQQEKSVQKEAEIEIPFMKEDGEKFIHSFVTEIPGKLET